MNLIWESIVDACRMIGSGDSLVFAACWRSLWITTVAVLIASVIGLPIGISLGRGRNLLCRFLETGFRATIALPTVFVGLMCYAFFANQGPLGSLDLLFTPWAIVIGEVFLAIPIIVSQTAVAIRSLDPRIDETARTLGASNLWRWRLLTREAKRGIVLAMMTAFGRCVTELGIAMIVGGNIKSQTRTLATATAMETGQGEFARAMAMGLILLAMALTVTVLIGLLAKDTRPD